MKRRDARRYALAGGVQTLPLVVAIFGGCTLDAGHGFATMHAGELSVELAPGRARDLGDHAVLTNLGYEVRLTRLQLVVERVELQELRGDGGSGGRFDPANPAPGSLCHGGHCHAADGSLPSDEEVQEASAGAAAIYQPLVSMAVDQRLDMLAGESAPLASFEPSRELPEGSIDRVVLVIGGLRGEAEIHAADGVQALRLELDLDVELAHAFDLHIDRHGPQRLSPRIALRAGGTLFDDIDFEMSAVEGALVLDDASAPAAAVLIDSLVDSELQVSL